MELKGWRDEPGDPLAKVELKASILLRLGKGIPMTPDLRQIHTAEWSQ